MLPRRATASVFSFYLRLEVGAHERPKPESGRAQSFESQFQGSLHFRGNQRETGKERTYRHTMCTWTDSGAGQTTWLGSRFICASVPLAVSPSLFLSHSLPVCHSISLSLSLSICLYLSIPLGARKVNFVTVPHVAATIDAEKWWQWQSDYCSSVSCCRKKAAIKAQEKNTSKECCRTVTDWDIPTRKRKNLLNSNVLC